MIRTPGLRLRRQSLYPLSYGAKVNRKNIATTADFVKPPETFLRINSQAENMNVLKAFREKHRHYSSSADTCQEAGAFAQEQH